MIEISEKKKELFELMDDYWEDYKEKRDSDKPFIVKPSVPVIWFGDIEAYFSSRIRVVTVAINPSKEEFPKACERFNGYKKLANKDTLSKSDKKNLYHMLNCYFKQEGNPYYDWFYNFDVQCMGYMPEEYRALYYVQPTTFTKPDQEGKMIEKFKQIYKDAFDENKKAVLNTAVHIDLLTAIATDPTWKDLGKLPMVESEREQMENLKNHTRIKNDVDTKLLTFIRQKYLSKPELFIKLLNILNPNIVLISTAAEPFKNVFKIESEPDFRFTQTRTRKNGTSIEVKELESYLVNNRLVIWGLSSNGSPFAFSDSDKNKGFSKIYSGYSFNNGNWELIKE
ncbi:MAG: hypothetical protein IKF09_03240 [Clostridiales bacterium]|nr:hypothetical protein [Clostridiales bacterium]